MKRYKPLFESTPDYDLNKKYNEFNKLYFNNELPDSIKVVWNGRLKSKAGQTDGRHSIEINPDLETEIEVDSTLVHEMIHVNQKVKGISDIHGPFFKAEAERLNKLNPKLHIGTKHSSIFNVEILKGKEIIPVYVAFYSFEKDAKFSQNTIHDFQVYSYDNGVEKKIQTFFLKTFYKTAFLFKVSGNTPYFRMDYWEDAIDKKIFPKVKTVKALTSFTKKDKENFKFVKEILREGI